MNKLNNSKSKKIQILKQLVRKVFLIAFILFSFILIFIAKPDSFIINKTSGMMVEAMSPFISVVSYPIYKIGSFIEAVKTFNKVDEQNANLKSEISKLTEELNYYKGVEVENANLRKLTNFISNETKYILSARILGSTGSGFSHSLIIDAGSKDGVEKYHGVLVDGYLVGQITSVGPKHSRILLITDSNSKIPVQIERTGTRAFLTGHNSKYPKLIHFENQEPIQIGDRVITSGMGGNLPALIPIGIVGSTGEDEGVILQPFIDGSGINYVKIIKTSNSESIREFLRLIGVEEKF